MTTTPLSTFQFTDFVTGEPKTFSYNDRGGSTLSMFTNNRINTSLGVAPVYLGTINHYNTVSDMRRGVWTSISLGATIRRTAPGGPIGELTYGSYRISILDGLPTGLSYRVENDEVVFYGNDIQSIPPEIQQVIDNPTTDNYPVNMVINNLRCYFRIRAERISFPDTLYSTWLYYFIVRTNWSTIRDAFIGNMPCNNFSFDQIHTVSNQEFIDTQKADGYYL